MSKQIIRKQGQVNWRDLLNSGYYAVVIPVLVKIQELIDKGVLDFSWKDLAVVAVSALISHLLRKAVESSKVITIQGDGGGNPPPIGDPTHPIR